MTFTGLAVGLGDRLRRAAPLLVIVGMFATLAAVQAGDPLVIDEMEFPRLAEAVAETGRPVYYRGEESVHHVGVFHPPGYAYALGGWIWLTGFTNSAVRAFGILVMLATAAVALNIVRQMGITHPVARAGFLALFLLHPLTVQSALLPDIDGSVMLLATAWVIRETVVLAQRGLAVAPVARLGLAIALMLGTKLTSALALGLVLGILLVRLGPRRGVLGTVMSSLIGAGLFLLGWAAVAWAADVPFAYPFEFTLASGLKGGAADTTVGELFGRLVPRGWLVFWLGVGLPILGLWGGSSVLRTWRSNPGLRPALPLALYSVLVYAFYSLITGPPFGFPKYHIAEVLTLALASAPLLAREWRLEHPNRGWLLVLAGLVVASAAWLGSSPASGSYDAPFAVLALGAIPVVGAAWWAVGGGAGPGTPLVAGLFAVLIAFNLGIDTFQAGEVESVRYFPGDEGFDETVAYLRGRVATGEAILAPKDIGSALNNHYFQVEYNLANLDDLETVVSDEVEYAVVRTGWDYSFLVFPAAEPVIEEFMDVDARIGDFIVYRATDG
jgi:hypothetical protein